MTKRWLRYVAIGIVAIVIYRVFLRQDKEVIPLPRDYAEILESDTLRATTEYNSISMVAGSDSIEGFHLELVEAFAREHGLQVLVTPEMSMSERLQGLAKGKYDLIADGIPVTANHDDSLLFTVPITRSSQVLVQRKPLNAEDSLKHIKSQVELRGKTLHVVKDSPAIMRIKNMIAEIGDTIYINMLEKYGAEQLLALVAYGDIDYAVCDRNIAQLAADSLPQLDLSIPIGFTQFYAWGVNKQSPILLDSINAWLERYQKTETYKALAKKYNVN
ncbi:MAG: transporter substrate-binding domain-containing protein [Bacteroidaceae bacterium]|nr:transporter substrate-binding domain-containing protein [Bacteroidaceae bacterium]